MGEGIGLKSARTQIVFLGIIALTCPGLFNALNGLGAAGSNDNKYANAGNTTLYAVFAVSGFLGGAFFNLLGNKVLLGVGGATYMLYALSLYLSMNIDKVGWLCIIGGAFLGLGAALFWTAQGAMMMAYSTAHNRGSYISLFWILFNIGGVLGGFIQMGINWVQDTQTKANPASYFTFIALMGVGCIMVPFVIVSPHKVRKADGSEVSFEKSTNAAEEVIGALKVFGNVKMLLLTALFLASNWFYTYQFNFINGSLFTIRTRGLNTALYWASQMLGAFIVGNLMDSSRMTKKGRGIAGWAMASTMFVIAWSLGSWLQFGFGGGYDKDNSIVNSTQGLIDLKQTRRCVFPTIIFCLYGFADACQQAFAYWIMGAVASGSTKSAARFAGYYKGVQSAGAAVAWGIDLAPRVTYKIQFFINFSLWALGAILAYFALADVPNDEDEDAPLPAAYAKSISVLGNPAEGAIQSVECAKASRSQTRHLASGESLQKTNSALKQEKESLQEKAAALDTQAAALQDNNNIV